MATFTSTTPPSKTYLKNLATSATAAAKVPQEAADILAKYSDLAMGTQTAQQEQARKDIYGQLEKGQGVQTAQFQAGGGYQLPWLSQGGAAVARLGSLMGLPQAGAAAPAGAGGIPLPAGTPEPVGAPGAAPEGYGSLARPFGMADYQADPGYQFRMTEGLKALERSSAAKGGLMSGGALKGIADYSQGLASQEYGNAYSRYNQNQENLYSRLMGLSGQGQSAASNMANLGANYANQFSGLGANAAGQVSQLGAGTANQISDLLTSKGTALSAGKIGTENAWQSGLAPVRERLGNFYTYGNQPGGSFYQGAG